MKNSLFVVAKYLDFTCATGNETSPLEKINYPFSRVDELTAPQCFPDQVRGSTIVPY